MSNNIQNQSDDCLSCRLATGFGIIGIGCYIWRCALQSKKRGRIEINSMKLISIGAISIGIARLLNLQFLKKK